MHRLSVIQQDLTATLNTLQHCIQLLLQRGDSLRSSHHKAARLLEAAEQLSERSASIQPRTVSGRAVSAVTTSLSLLGVLLFKHGCFLCGDSCSGQCE